MLNTVHVTSFPFRNLYRDVFLNHADAMDHHRLIRRPAKIHVNKLGRKRYGRVFFTNNGEIKGDETILTFGNGLEFCVRRRLKPVHVTTYKDLIRQKSSAEIRERIKSYTGEIIGAEHLPTYVLAALGAALSDIFQKESRLSPQTLSNFTTERVSVLNAFLQTAGQLPEWSFSQETEDEAAPSITGQKFPVPWVRRRDKKFTPEWAEYRGTPHVVAETRTYLGENSLALRVRRLFQRPLDAQEYDDYKTKFTKTIRDLTARKTLDLFEENKTDILSSVSEYQFYPLALVDPYRAERFYDGNKAFPYIRGKTLKTENRTLVKDLHGFVAELPGIISQKDTVDYTRTHKATDVSLVLKFLASRAPCNISLSIDGFFTLASAAWHMESEQRNAPPDYDFF
jgi:hypothetical protein